MTEEQAIKLLESKGYTVVSPNGEGNPYLSLGELWENNPKLYRKVWINDREKYSALLDAVDFAEMVKTWSDATIYSVREHGPDLAVSADKRRWKKQFSEIKQACIDENLRRYPIKSRPTNGMTE